MPVDHSPCALQTKFYLGARTNFRERVHDSGGDPFRGALSEVRLWKRCLAEDELGMPLNTVALPDGLVRWVRMTDEDEESPECKS